MTIVKPFFKLLSLLLLLFLFPSSLLSCQKETIDLPFELLTEPSDAQSEQEELSAYRLILPISSSAEQILTPDANGHVSITFPSQEIHTYSHASRTVASLKLGEESLTRAELTALSDRLKTKSPSILSLNTEDQEALTSLATLLSDRYSAVENTSLFQTGTAANFLWDLSEEMSVPARLYQIGEGNEAFLLLVLEGFSEGELPDVLRERSLPLLVLVHTELSDAIDAAPSFANTAFDLLLFQTTWQGLRQNAFAVYAEPDCFTLSEESFSEDCSFFTVKRRLAFYPNPT